MKVPTSIISNRKTYEQVEKGFQHFFRKFTGTLIESEDFVSALRKTLEEICRFGNWTLGEIWLPDAAGILNLEYVWHTGGKNAEEFARISRDFNFPPGVGIPGRAWKSKRAEWVRDVSQEPETSFLRVEAAKKYFIKAAFGIPLVIDSEVVAVFVFFMREVKERDEKLINEIFKTMEELSVFFKHKKLDKFKEQFISAIGHQIRNPLTATRWVLEELLSGTALGETERKKLEKIYRENQTLIELINDLLILSRVENPALQSETVRLDEEISNIILAPKNKYPDVVITFANEAGPVSIDTVRPLALQVFLNIVFNAAEHADKKAGKVMVKFQRIEQDFIFSCHNNGEPIPENMKPKIFTKIISTTGGGAGLGLFIAKMVCDYFGWRVYFDTGQDGTTFYVKIPFPNR